MGSATPSRRIAIVGAGWAGLAAAIECIDLGHKVTLFEATRIAGGRARRLASDNEDGSLKLDNGQHILSGAYGETLRLMRHVGVTDAAFLRMPLTLEFADGSGMRALNLPRPFDIAGGLLFARGWSLKDKWSLIRAGSRWKKQNFVCDERMTVAQLCAPLTKRMCNELIEPLCVAALNTPIATASAQVFLRVLKDALFANSSSGESSSDLLLPRVDLGELFPSAAITWLANRGATIRFGDRVERIEPDGESWNVSGEIFDAVFLATPATESARIVERSGIDSPEWLAAAKALEYEAITTVYGTSKKRLRFPMLALRSTESRPAQYVFDRQILIGTERMISFVVSASKGTNAEIESQVNAQAAEQLEMRDFEVVKTVTEKRATFACTAGMIRPSQLIAPRVLACGDYVEGPYPATLEGALRSGVQAARALARAQFTSSESPAN